MISPKPKPSLPLPPMLAFASRADKILHVLRTFVYLRPWLLVLYKAAKYVYGILTNSSELYRLCHDQVSANSSSRPGAVSAVCISRIDESLLYSTQLTLERRTLELKDCGLDEVTKMVLLKKRFPGNGSLDTPEAGVLYSALSVIHESHRVISDINVRVKTKYDSANQAHERLLLELWTLVMPTDPLTGRISGQWSKIGFQGTDPATDFRGMGLHGLDDLVYIARAHPTLTRRLLDASHHPISWYSWAIVGINISSFVVSMLRTRRLQYLMYHYGPTQETVAEFYCHVSNRFLDRWTGWSGGQPPLTIMDFERVFGTLRDEIEQQLALREVVLDLSSE